MKKFVFKLGSSIATVALLASVLTPAAFASSVDISGNGANSTSNVVLNESNNTSVNQSSTTNVGVEASLVSSTGGNQANFNTGGDVGIATGNATANVSVNVSGGSNDAKVNNCGCENNNVDVTISGNGALSHNKVKVSNNHNLNVKQKTLTDVFVGVSLLTKTGKNQTNFNTGGSVLTTTGDASGSLDIGVSGGSNTLNP